MDVIRVFSFILAILVCCAFPTVNLADGSGPEIEGDPGENTHYPSVGIEEARKVQPPTGKVDYMRYREELLKKLATLKLPKKARFAEIYMDISKDKGIEYVQIHKSCGSRQVDKKTVNAIERLPLGPLPTSVPGHVGFKINLSELQR